MRRKSIILTIVAAILYLSQSLIRGILIGTLNVNETFAELSSAFLVLLIIFFLIGKKERQSYFGIRLWECDNCFKINGLLFLIPLVNLPYLFFGARINIMVAVINSIFVGIMEELIFRGFLCRFIEEKSHENRAIMISSLIFGVFHLVNIGSYPYLYVLLQVLYAFAIGIVFATVFYKTKSILNCIIVHSIVDILGSFEAEPIFAVEIIGTIICVLYAIYYYLFVRKQTA
ncbi:MAG: CPBP family intramembrane metalloprotease [Lachnospiraceae bacterium]|nr:CPBP family intramembrane metalloprotease [Lachnospiraceae bacterium]